MCGKIKILIFLEKILHIPCTEQWNIKTRSACADVSADERDHCPLVFMYDKKYCYLERLTYLDVTQLLKKGFRLGA